jgi:anti-anti-sigma regulatory factor
MEVKIDTKEKFNVITLNEPLFSDNIAAELATLVLGYLGKDLKNVVLKLPATTHIDETAAFELTRIQHSFYEGNASFVICELKPELEQQLDEMELLEVMNITPTESEAWDIVQMEEIERELLDADDVEFNSHGEK